MNEPLLRRVSNRVLHLMARFLPGSKSLRPFLHRLRGVRWARIFSSAMMCLSKMSIPPHNFQIHSDGPYFALRRAKSAHRRFQ
jgi:hypothetical protein